MTNRDRAKDFPATSIGRTSGARLTSTVQESHPLGLNTPLPESATTKNTGLPQRYLPYTPRTRGAPSPSVAPSQTTAPPTMTPGTLIHPPSPQHHHRLAGGDDATTKLQLTNAKAEAQNVGLNTHTGGSEGPSVGWAMLEKIVCESETGEVWAEIWSAITTGKECHCYYTPKPVLTATVLLPAEALSSTDRLTPEFFKDHIAYYDTTVFSFSDVQPTHIVTLSGLRGFVHHNAITFTSTLHPSSPLFHPLRDANTRASSIRKLPPLPFDVPPKGFPYFTIVTQRSTLPLPPKTQTSKPPLPPRPGARPLPNVHSTSHSSSAPSSNSRILNPFASLFGNRPSTPTPPPPPPVVAASPPASIRSLESSQYTTDPHAVVDIEVIVIDTKVSRRHMEKEMNKHIQREIKVSLSSPHGVAVPDWVAARVLEFCEHWFPFVRATKTISSSKPVGGSEKGKKEEEWVVNTMEVDRLDDTVDFLQDFYEQLEDYLRVELNNSARSPEGEGKDDIDSEARILKIMESVENTVCLLFYDRLFTQPQTDDSSHDLTLSNRIAALNLLDLSLEHLDIAVEQNSKVEVENVVKICGRKLCDLDKVRTPKQKARILVAAHQVIVDGLSRLPPVRLMTPDESKVLKEQQPDLLKDKRLQAHEADVGSTSSPGGSPAVSAHTATVPVEGATISEPSDSTTLGNAKIDTTATQPELSPLLIPAASELPLATTLVSSSPTSEVPPSLPTDPDSDPAPPPSSRITSPEVQLSQAKPHEPTPVSSDVLLPMLIFSVVKSNPPHFVSNLLYIQRFRRRNAYSGEGGGEESFCLINMLAVAEFLEDVDLEALGLGARRDVNATDLTPIIPRSPQTPLAPSLGTLTPKSSSGAYTGIEGLQLTGLLRGKVEQQVDAIAGSANKVISGVVDSSFGILRSFLPQNAQAHPGTGVNIDALVGGEDGDVVRTNVTAKTGQGFGLLRRETGFSIASIAASLPVPGMPSSSRSKTQSGEEGQQLVDVGSRPGSIKSMRSAKGGEAGRMDNNEGSDEDDGARSEDEDQNEESDDDEESGSVTSEEDNSESDDHGSDGVDIPGNHVDAHPYASSSSGVAKHASASAGSFGTDTRSIRSFESMMSDSKKRQKEKKLKALAKANEKERKREQRKAKAQLKEGENISVSASRASAAPRKSLTDRLASVGALAGGAKGSPSDSRASSLLHPPHLVAPVPLPVESIRQLSSTHLAHGGSSASSRGPSPAPPLSRSLSPDPTRTSPSQPTVIPNRLSSSVSITDSATRVASTPLASGSSLNSPKLLAPPRQRFLECRVDELSIKEVGELLSEYRRLVDGVRQLGGFVE